MIYYDTESTSLHGVTVIIQWCLDDGPIEIFCPWQNPAKETLRLIEMMMSHEEGICGFNLTFDHFHLSKLYNTFRLLDPDVIPLTIIDEVALAEEKARNGPCLKPVKALDLMLHSRKGPYQSLMDRKDIVLKRVPMMLARPLADQLEADVHLNPIYFARKKKNYERQWQIEPIEDDPEFVNIVMRFAPSTALKVLVGDALKVPKEEILTYSEVEIDKKYYSQELGYAPFALALGKPDDWKGMWPDVLHYHIQHWTTNELARKYARLDVDYLRRLRKEFGWPEAGDDDSELACSVASCRWRGYNIDLKGIEAARQDAEIKANKVPTDTRQVRPWLEAVMSPTEIVASEMHEKGSTKRQILEKMRDKLFIACPECPGANCPRCHGIGKVRHPVGERAKDVIEARTAFKEVELYTKLLIAGRLHADFKIIGTFTSRMSGASDLNLHGIDSRTSVRSKFLFAYPPDVLCGGDFASFEVVIAIAVWGDKQLEELVQSYRPCHKCQAQGEGLFCAICKGKKKVKNQPCKTCQSSGRGERLVLCECPLCEGKRENKIKIHAVFGTHVYPQLSYEQILDSDGTEEDYYTRSKSSLFQVMYGGTPHGMSEKLGIDEEAAEEGANHFFQSFPGIAKAKAKTKSMFCSMRQPGGIGGKVEWHEPAEYIEEPILGHRRYFTLENKVCKTLFDLAQNLPKEWQAYTTQVRRRDRIQKVGGAVQSALYACAFSLQAANLRAVDNHLIQAAGAKICKSVQRKIWDLQPSGIHEFKVQPINIHDEILVVSKPDYQTKVTETVKTSVKSLKDKVSLLAIDWKEDMASWASKKG